MGYKSLRTRRYRPATQEEIQQAGREVEDAEDWQAARDYALRLFGPTVARVKLVIDHNFDDGEESRYVKGDFYGSRNPASYETVEINGYWFQPDDVHRGWDAGGNELPLIVTLRRHYLYGDDEEYSIDTPEFNNYDPWHMEFDLTQEPSVTVLYVEEK